MEKNFPLEEVEKIPSYEAEDIELLDYALTNYPFNYKLKKEAKNILSHLIKPSEISAGFICFKEKETDTSCKILAHQKIQPTLLKHLKKSVQKDSFRALWEEKENPCLLKVSEMSGKLKKLLKQEGFNYIFLYQFVCKKEFLGYLGLFLADKPSKLLDLICSISELFAFFITNIYQFKENSLWRLKFKEELDFVKEDLFFVRKFNELLLNYSPLFIVFIDFKYRIRLFNARSENLTGYKKQEVFGRSILDFIYPEDYELLLKLKKNLTDSLHPVHLSFRFLRKDGRIFYCESEAILLTNDHGNVLGTFIAGYDVTDKEIIKKEKRDLEEKTKKSIELIEETARYLIKIDLVQQSLVEINSLMQVKEIKRKALAIAKKLVNAPFGEIILIREKGFLNFFINKIQMPYMMIVPIYFQEAVLGYFSLESPKGAFMEEDFKIIDLFALQLGVTLEKVHSYQQVKSSRDYLDLVLTAVTDAFIAVDRRGRVRLWNNFCETLFGYKYKDVVGKEILNLNLVAQEVIIAYGEQIMEEGHCEGEVEFIRQDGSTFWGWFKFKRLSEEDKVSGYLGVIRDITEKKMFEEEIISYNRQLNNINSFFTKISGALTLEDTLSQIEQAIELLLTSETFLIFGFNQESNNSWCILNKGLPNEYVDYLTKRGFFYQNGFDYFKQPLFFESQAEIRGYAERISKLQKQKIVPLHEKLNLDFKAGIAVPLGYYKDYSIAMAIFYKEEKEFSPPERELTLNLSYQISLALKKALLFEELQQKTKQLEAKNAEIEDFVYTVSHDLKNPLISIYGIADFLVNNIAGGEEKVVRHYLDRLKINVSDIDNLIDGLLQLSRAGRIRRVYENIDVRRLITFTVSQFEEEIKNRNIKITIADQLPSVYGDPIQLGQIFSNLISNAVKFTAEQVSPHIEIGGMKKESQAEFFIKDNGIGINESNYERIFKVFCQLKEIKGLGGTGIGLAIVKKILESNDGSIKVSSAKGRGTTFSFTVPASWKERV